jgi:hypothetical protein
MCGIFETMRESGWELVVSSDLVRASTDASTLVFKAGPVKSQQLHVVALSTHESDKLRIVNADSSEVERIQNAVREAVATAWPKGIQAERFYAGAPEFKLKGTPWWADGEDNVHVQRLVSALLGKMASLGYASITSCDVSKKERDSDTMFFVRTDVAQPALPRTAISLNKYDTIRLIDGPAELQHVVQQAVRDAWKRSIQKIESYHGAMSLKLAGNPWWANGTEAVESRVLMCHVISEMARCGWSLELTADLSRKDSDKSSFFFVQSSSPISAESWAAAARPWCISFNATDRVRLLGAPPEILTHIEAAICSGWPRGIQDRRQYGGSEEFKLAGNPWHTQDWGSRGLNTALACALLRTLEEHGFMVFASADISAKYYSGGEGGDSYKMDVDSWFVMRRPVASVEVTAPPALAVGAEVVPMPDSKSALGAPQPLTPPIVATPYKG